MGGVPGDGGPGGGQPKSPWVFPSQHGGRWGHNLHRGFTEIVHKAGIDYCNSHDKRETICSTLANAGYNGKVVQTMAGRKWWATTAKYYGGIDESTPDSAADVVGNIAAAG